MKLLIHPAVDSYRLGRIRAAAGAMSVVNAASPDEAATAIPDADAYFGKITPALLARAARLRWIQSSTASLEHYMFPALVDHPAVLTNMRGLFSDVIADQVMGYIICFARNLHIYIRQQLEARWAPVGVPAFQVDYVHGAGVSTDVDRSHRHLAGSTAGIVGLGAIGAEVAARARAFGMNIVAVDPVNPSAWPIERLPDLLAASDFVVICAPHTPRTAGMFSTAQFEQMRRDAYLINIGRGAIVDLAALAGALRHGVIAGAALDVFETEPLPSDHPLWRMPNTILTPHIAGYSPAIAARHLEVLLDNIGRFVRGEPLHNVANKAEWY